MITGSAGFIFSNFIRYLLQNSADYQVCSIDKILQSQTLHTIYSNKNHTFYIGDVADAHFVNIVFETERPDFIIHGAAESFVDHSIKDATPFVHSNVLGTQVMVDCAVKWGVEKFILTSTDEVYGQLTSEEESAWTEESPPNPRNPYSASKMASELIVKAAHYTHGLSYNITRSCNNYGNRQPNRNLIPKVISSILNNEPIRVYGEGAEMRDWLYVMDNCRALLRILEQAPANEVYNISAKQEYKNIEVVQLICNLMERGHNLITHVENRKGHDYRYAVDNTKILSLGWKPEIKFKQGLQDTISWYTNNQWFLKNKVDR